MKYKVKLIFYPISSIYFTEYISNYESHVCNVSSQVKRFLVTRDSILMVIERSVLQRLSC